VVAGGLSRRTEQSGGGGGGGGGEQQDQRQPEEEAAAFEDADAEGCWRNSPEPGANLLLVGSGDEAGAVTYIQGEDAGTNADLCSGTLQDQW
jgi:hypothetical protein